MKNKCIIIYESIYNGNTLKLAKAMAQTLGCMLVTTDKALTMNLDDFETIGLGSGIYFGKHHPKLFVVANKLSGHQDVFIFSSRGNPFLGKYHQPLKDVLNEKNKNIIGEFSVRGYDETGPWVIIGGGNVGKPNENDLKKASKFIKKCLPQFCMPDYYLQINKTLPVKEGFVNAYELRGNDTMVAMHGDYVTVNQNACMGCGKCLKVCPLAVIELINNKAFPVKELDCTLCRLCVINCSERAISLHYTWIDAIKVAVRHGKRNSL
jgi:NAD-dependent dihydropyrimidine dehydrogenase PreA subunit/flavodoxin